MKYEYLKGSEKDFEGAPEWCTHVSKSPSKGWIAWEQAGESKKGNMYQWNDGGSPVNTYERGGALLNIIAERRPITEPEWDGVGLPPVGCECEIELPQGWASCIIKYSSEYVIVYDPCDSCGEFSSSSMAYKLRPLRSEADKNRDDFIRAMINLDKRILSSTENRYGEIYDAIAAGKIPGVKLED